jgi:hypothetical protein
MASPFHVKDDSLFGSGSESEDGMDMENMEANPFMLNDGMQFWSPIDVYLWVTTVCGVSEDWGVSEGGALHIGKAFAEVE